MGFLSSSGEQAWWYMPGAEEKATGHSCPFYHCAIHINLIFPSYSTPLTSVTTYFPKVLIFSSFFPFLSEKREKDFVFSSSEIWTALCPLSSLVLGLLKTGMKSFKRCRADTLHWRLQSLSILPGRRASCRGLCPLCKVYKTGAQESSGASLLPTIMAQQSMSPSLHLWCYPVACWYQSLWNLRSITCLSHQTSPISTRVQDDWNWATWNWSGYRGQHPCSLSW